MDVQSYYAPTSVLRNIASRLQQNLATRSSVFDADAARDLYFCFVQPLLARLDTTQLVVVLPAGARRRAVRGVDGSESRQFLGETLTVSYAPSASVLMRQKQGAELDAANVLAVAGPRLGNATRDADAIASTFPRHDGRSAWLGDALHVDARGARTECHSPGGTWLLQRGRSDDVLYRASTGA